MEIKTAKDIFDLWDAFDEMFKRHGGSFISDEITSDEMFKIFLNLLMKRMGK